MTWETKQTHTHTLAILTLSMSHTNNGDRTISIRMADVAHACPVIMSMQRPSSLDAKVLSRLSKTPDMSDHYAFTQIYSMMHAQMIHDAKTHKSRSTCFRIPSPSSHITLMMSPGLLFDRDNVRRMICRSLKMAGYTVSCHTKDKYMLVISWNDACEEVKSPNIARVHKHVDAKSMSRTMRKDISAVMSAPMQGSFKRMWREVDKRKDKEGNKDTASSDDSSGSEDGDSDGDEQKNKKKATGTAVRTTKKMVAGGGCVVTRRSYARKGGRSGDGGVRGVSLTEEATEQHGKVVGGRGGGVRRCLSKKVSNRLGEFALSCDLQKK